MAPDASVQFTTKELLQELRAGQNRLETKFDQATAETQRRLTALEQRVSVAEAVASALKDQNRWLIGMGISTILGAAGVIVKLLG